MKVSFLGIGVAAAAMMSFALGRLSSGNVRARLQAEESTLSGSKLVLRSARGAAAQQGSNVLSETVRRTPSEQVIQAIGTVRSDDSKVYRLVAGSAGRLTTLGSNSPGTIVRKDEILASFFSNELVKAQQAYFFALQAMQRDRTSHTGVDGFQSQESVRSQEGTLTLMGMGEVQLRDLAKTREATRDIHITSPANGLVVSRNLYPTQVLEQGQEMYRIIGLDTVWVVANVSVADAIKVAPGSNARVVEGRTGEVFNAKVTSLVPLSNSAGQALEVKLEVDNHDMKLLPDMRVEVELQAAKSSQITVPGTAVVDTGFDRLVFVQGQDGSYQARSVNVGQKVGDRVIILRGLFHGERVAVLGHFLQDSESRLYR